MSLTVKETKEALVGANRIALVLVEKMSDGIDFSDFMAFYETLTKDEEFQKVIKEAWDGRSEISNEMGDIDLSEGLELVQVQIGFIPKYIEALKKSKTKE